jgi:hypothetical protein
LEAALQSAFFIAGERMDGGKVTSPSLAFFSPMGQWDVENHGVDPDYVVEQAPKAVSEGTRSSA